MSRKRNKKKIANYKVDEYAQNEFSRSEAKQIQDRLNGVEKHPKNLIKDIIKSTPRVKFKNEKQSIFHGMLMDKDVVACQGSAGTGKTFIAVYSAIKLLLADNGIHKIVVTKPSQQLKAENLGFVKGGLDEKIAPIMESYDDVFEELLGKEAFRSLVEEGIIIHQPLSFIRGRTLKNAVIIFDEVQMTTIHVLRTLMQRMGESSKIYLLGDEVQIERGNRKFNPLTQLYNKLENHPNELFGTFKFGLSDIVRNPLISLFEEIFEEIEKDMDNNNPQLQIA